MIAAIGRSLSGITHQPCGHIEVHPNEGTQQQRDRQFAAWRRQPCTACLKAMGRAA